MSISCIFRSKRTFSYRALQQFMRKKSLLIYFYFGSLQCTFCNFIWDYLRKFWKYPKTPVVSYSNEYNAIQLECPAEFSNFSGIKIRNAVKIRGISLKTEFRKIRIPPKLILDGIMDTLDSLGRLLRFDSLESMDSVF